MIHYTLKHDGSQLNLTGEKKNERRKEEKTVVETDINRICDRDRCRIFYLRGNTDLRRL